MTKRFFLVCAGLLCLAIAYHLGTGTATAQSTPTVETAYLTGTVPDGGTIPLPRYIDGTEALESECRWIVSPYVASTTICPTCGVVCYTTGRVVTVGAGGSGGSYGTANFLVIATRAIGAVEAQRNTWGQLKNRYR